MHCSGCGKDIPFGGQVCPYCQRDKSSDQTATVTGMVGMAFGGFIGNAISGFGGMIVGGLIGAVIVAIISLSGKNHSAKKPPRIRTTDIDRKSERSSPPPNKPNDDAAARLKRLDSLKAEGLVTEAEYQSQRRAIIAAV